VRQQARVKHSTDLIASSFKVAQTAFDVCDVALLVCHELFQSFAGLRGFGEQSMVMQ